jgi:hypothetical protein
MSYDGTATFHRSRCSGRLESAILGPTGGCSRVGMVDGPLPVGIVVLRALAPVLIQLHVALGAVGAPSITPVQRLRDAIALVFR